MAYCQNKTMLGESLIRKIQTSMLHLYCQKYGKLLEHICLQNVYDIKSKKGQNEA